LARRLCRSVGELCEEHVVKSATLLKRLHIL
jgi:hypothetical protein